MKVILTEKPSVAREIAKVLNIKTIKEGYIAGEDYTITWAFGHLIELCPPEEYGWLWSRDCLPMLPSNFRIRPAHKWDKIKRKLLPDSGVEKQLSIIAGLFENCDEIIVATDAGREGELIFRYIYQYLECGKPFQRLWLSSMSENAILKAFKNLKPGKKFDNLFLSAKARSEADWLVGMNASRALTLGSGSSSAFSIGRVQTPTLAIICDRFIHNRDFVAEPYYTIRINVEKQGNHRFFAISEPYKNKELATSSAVAVGAANLATVTKIEQKEKIESAPLLYDLTTLQREANKIFGYSADTTLKLAQSLYEAKLLTYPRTGSQFISEDDFSEIPRLLETVSAHPVFAEAAAELMSNELNKRSVNAEKVTDHHAILITENIPENLGQKEQSIYDLVLIKMLESFSQDCIKDFTKIDLNCGGINFTAKGSVISPGHEGWKKIKEYANFEAFDNDGESIEENQKLPDLIPFEQLDKIDSQILTKKTKPKPIHTEGSLLLAMETCGNNIEDEEAREAMKGVGIGTPATRASIIEAILSRGYIERNKKQLLPTPRGLAVYNLLKDKSITSSELTGKWETRLEQINNGNEDIDIFMNDIRDYSSEITKSLLQLGMRLQSEDLSTTNKLPIMCPACKTGELRKGQKNYYCSNYPKKNAEGEYGEGCRFTIWPIVAGKSLSEQNVRQLSEKGKTSLIRGFTSKAGKSFNAYLILKNDNTIGFEFEQKKAASH